MTNSNIAEIYLRASHLANEAAKLSGMSIYSLDTDKGVILDQVNYVNKLLAEIPRSTVLNSSANTTASD